MSITRTSKILIIGAGGQIGTDLVKALCGIYGEASVVAADRCLPVDIASGPIWTRLDVLDKQSLLDLLRNYAITEIYHLAATLSANGEKQPVAAWDLNMRGLLNVLDAARELALDKVFWPSSIAVFGPCRPGDAATQYTRPNPATVYGISKAAGEFWCQYYADKFDLDVRSIRYPGLISHAAKPGGGTTDYAVDIFHKAAERIDYSCYLRHDTRLPMMYMPDAVRATIELMAAPKENISIRTSYNLAAMSFTPGELAQAIREEAPAFRIQYAVDHRQRIADSWPGEINDLLAQKDWGWKPKYDMYQMTTDMLQQLTALKY